MLMEKSADIPAPFIMSRILVSIFIYIPQDEQLCVLQLLQAFPAPATTRPSLWAEKSEIVRDV